MRITLGAFISVRRRSTNNVNLQNFPASRFLSTSQRLSANNNGIGTGQDAEGKRLHILGVGNIGTFVAHALVSIPQPPKVTLMLRHPEQYQVFKSIGRRLILQRSGLSEHKTGYDVNWHEEDEWYTTPQSLEGTDNRAAVDNSPIDHLILTVKITSVVTALMSVRHRLSPKSTIVFIHNGMGIIEQVNKEVFPDPNTRPSYVVGIISHGVYRYKYFNVVHRGIGTTTLGVVFSNPQASLPSIDSPTSSNVNNTPNTNSTVKDPDPKRERALAPSTRYLLNTFARTPLLVPFITNEVDLLLFQLEKLAVNALINPLSVINDCTNGNLLNNENILRVQRLLLYEISAVIGALPEVQGVPGIKSRFAPDRLLSLAQQVMKKTAANASSMLQDAAAGRITEIDWINGYIVRRGEELGITCALNYMLVNLVKGKARIMERNVAGQIPLDEIPLSDDTPP
ncbi:hypothetical protein VTO42DRAFT_1632 [Malbranchea cinnamomea]